jgi:hypothetical protein
MDSTDKDGISDADWDDTVAAICAPTPIDPRRGVPSASAMERIDACPGSWLASTLCPPSPDNADSTKGTRIHAALETGDTSSLSADESEMADMCRLQTNVLLEAWSTPDVVPAMHREQRLGLTVLGGVVEVTDATTARLVCTGQADVVYLDVDRALVIDYKTGRGDYEHAAGNAQLRTLASLVARRYRVSSVRVAIVQPWAGRPTVADFDAEALEAAHLWLGDVLVKALRATPADLVPGEWCKWCPAKATCPALRDVALAPVERLTISLPADDKVARQALFARAMELPADGLARLMRGLRLVSWYTDAIEGAAKVRAKDDEAFQAFYTLKPGVIRERITDLGLVWPRLEALGVTGDAFAKACSLTKSALTELVRTTTGHKGKALAAVLDGVLDGATESKETAKQLQEVKA